jgi:hypothetical protein
MDEAIEHTSSWELRVGIKVIQDKHRVTAEHSGNYVRVNPASRSRAWSRGLHAKDPSATSTAGARLEPPRPAPAKPAEIDE